MTVSFTYNAPQLPIVEHMVEVVSMAIWQLRRVRVNIRIDTTNQRELFLLHLAYQRITGHDIGAE